MCIVSGLGGCSGLPDYSGSPNYDSQNRIFVHPDGYRHDKGLFEVLGFMTKFWTRGADPAEKSGFPAAVNAEIQPDTKTHVTWIGHSTVLFEHMGKRVLTDPHFSKRASPLSFAGPKRVVAPGMAIADLPKIDAVIISHSHYDHFDLASIRDLSMAQPDIKFIVPLGLASMVRGTGAQHVAEIDWWQRHELSGLTVISTPVRHWSSRTPFDRNRTQWAGFMVRFEDGFQFYFAGDTGYGTDFVKARQRLGRPDFAAIPIGAYEPRDFMKSSHVTPEEAVRVFQDLEAPLALAIHWGTFRLTLEPLAEPPSRLEAALRSADIQPERFRVLRHGERWDF